MVFCHSAVLSAKLTFPNVSPTFIFADVFKQVVRAYDITINSKCARPKCVIRARTTFKIRMYGLLAFGQDGWILTKSCVFMDRDGVEVQTILVNKEFIICK